MPVLIRGIFSGGGKIKDATAWPRDVRSGKVFYNNQGRQIGNWKPSVTDYTGDATALPEDVKNGKVFYNSQGKQTGTYTPFEVHETIIDCSNFTTSNTQRISVNTNPNRTWVMVKDKTITGANSGAFNDYHASVALGATRIIGMQIDGVDFDIVSSKHIQNFISLNDGDHFDSILRMVLDKNGNLLFNLPYGSKSCSYKIKITYTK